MESTDQKTSVAAVKEGPAFEEKKNRTGGPGRPMATIDNDDERLLNQIGYTQV